MYKKIEDKIALILRPNVMEAAFALNDSDFKRLITKLYYCSRGKEDKSTGEEDNPMVKIIYEMEKPFLEYNLNRFIENNSLNN